MWDLGEAPKGNLVFTFTCDPAEYKKEVNRLTKEALAGADPKKGDVVVDPKKTKPTPKDFITEINLLKPVASL